MGEPLYATFHFRSAVVCPCGAVFAVGTNRVGAAVFHVDDGAFRQTHNGFCLAVLIPVVGGNVLLIVLEVAHIGTAVYPPE